MTLLHVHISRVAPGRRDIAANVLVWVILIPEKCFIGAVLFCAVFFGGLIRPVVVKAEIEAQLKKVSAELPGIDTVNIEEIHLRNGFVHRWHIETHVAGKNKEDLSLQACYPNPTKLPKLHLCGEAFSSEQGWT